MIRLSEIGARKSGVLWYGWNALMLLFVGANGRARRVDEALIGVDSYDIYDES